MGYPRYQYSCQRRQGLYDMIKPLTLWWLILITVAVAVFFFNIFRKVVRKYSDRIAALPDRVWIWQVFPPRGWILLMFMMGRHF